MQPLNRNERNLTENQISTSSAKFQGRLENQEGSPGQYDNKKAHCNQGHGHAGHTRKALRISKAAVDNCGKGVGNFYLS